MIGVLVAGVDVAPSDEAAARRQQQLREDAGDRVFFGEESAELGAHARRVLAGQVDWLRRHPTSVLCIEGHADERGDGARNLALSLQRAEKVRARLIESGVEEERLTVRALGNSRPVAICAEELCRAQNRRAVSIVAHRAAFDRAAMSISASNSGSRR